MRPLGGYWFARPFVVMALCLSGDVHSCCEAQRKPLL